MRKNELLLDDNKKDVPKLEDMQVHNWQASTIGALHKAGEAYLLGECDLS